VVAVGTTSNVVEGLGSLVAVGLRPARVVLGLGPAGAGLARVVGVVLWGTRGAEVTGDGARVVDEDGTVVELDVVDEVGALRTPCCLGRTRPLVWPRFADRWARSVRRAALK
jgi:hypothetical protein